MVENTKHVVRVLQKHIQKIGQNADLNRNKKIWKKVVLKKKCGSYIRIIDQQSTDQKSIFRKKRQRKGIFMSPRLHSAIRYSERAFTSSM